MTYNGNISGMRKSFKERAMDKVMTSRTPEQLEKNISQECDWGIKHGKCSGTRCDNCQVERCYNLMKNMFRANTINIHINTVNIKEVVR